MINRKPNRNVWWIAVALIATLAVTGVASAAETMPDGSGGGGGQRFQVSVDAVANFKFPYSGAFTTPVGASAPGPAVPGSAFEWKFYAAPGDRLSFATMLGQSNDWFFAPAEPGIPLYMDGRKMTGDVTEYVSLWDAGTEGDEALLAGPNQAPRQSGPNTGPDDPTGYVRQVLGPQIPSANEMVRVTLRDAGGSAFVLRIDNISGATVLPSPIAPGVGVVHTMPAPLFVNGEPDFGMGLEAAAEDGNPAMLADSLAAETGINTPLSPVAYTVGRELNPIFMVGARASSGLERLAEEGNAPALVPSLPGDAGVAAIGRGATQAGPIVPPHGNFSFTVMANSGDYLSLATMFGQSNDWFYALQNQPLFDADGDPISGDFTHVVHLYDAGTEVNGPIGFGPYQAPRQSAANMGPSEGGVVRQVTMAPYADASTVIHVTITPIYY